MLLCVGFMVACNSPNKRLPEVDAAATGVEISPEEGSFKDDDTMIVFGAGLSGSQAKNLPQKQEAKAIEQATSDAQRKAIEICIGVSVAACSVRPMAEKELQAAIKVGFRQFMKKCDRDQKTDQTGCRVGFEFRMEGLKTHCASKDAERRRGSAARCGE